MAAVHPLLFSFLWSAAVTAQRHYHRLRLNKIPLSDKHRHTQEKKGRVGELVEGKSNPSPPSKGAFEFIHSRDDGNRNTLKGPAHILAFLCEPATSRI